MSIFETFLMVYLLISFAIVTLIMVKSYRKKLPNQDFFDSMGTPTLLVVYLIMMMIAPVVFIGTIFKKLVFTK